MMTPIPACVALSYPSVFVRANPQESVYEFLGRGNTLLGEVVPGELLKQWVLEGVVQWRERL